MSLNSIRWIALAAMVCASPLGCATTSDVDELRIELASTREAAVEAQRQATAASAEARAASDEARKAATAAAGSAAEAQAASEKVEKVFQKSLRK